MQDNLEPGASGAPDNSIVPENVTPETNSSQSLWGELGNDDKELVSNKGFKTPADVLKSYREMEKSASSKISLPKDDDKEGRDKLFARLGRPETAEGYELSEVSEAEAPVIDEYKATCLQNNILPEQAKNLHEWYKENQRKADEAFSQQSKKEFDEIQTSWGDDAAKNQEIMKRGAKVLGLSQDLLENIEISIGTKEYVRMALALGNAISEDTAKGMGGGGTKNEAMSTEDFIKEIFGNQ